jgi:hypothetical protein
MTVTVSPTETQQWIRTRDNRTGRQIAVAVASKSVAGKYHLVSLGSCDCKGFGYRGTCSHLKAVQAEAAKVKAERSDLVDGGAAHLAVKRAAGEWPATQQAQAALYREIFEGDQ